MSLKLIFTWWNKQTLGTFLKTLSLENMLVLTNKETNIIKVKKTKDGLFTLKVLKLQKLHLIGFYGCIIQLIRFQIIRTKNILGKKNTKKIKQVQAAVINQLK